MIVPATIAPHLIPFLYEEFGSDDVKHEGSVIKVATISPFSSMGAVLSHCIKISATMRERPKNVCYLQFPEKCDHFTHMYGCMLDDRGDHIMLSIEGARFLNNFLEDILRLALVNYVTGRLDREEDDVRIKNAIGTFMEAYQLHAYGFGLEGFRQMYYRDTRREGLLKRFRIRPRYKNSIPHVT
jgi:hypothetical protein